jgi:predicted DCC family thiol-disulfide oxidoreductase YuxK
MNAPQVQDVLVFDGECAFCRAQAQRIHRWDRWNRIECVAKQTPGLGDRFPVLNRGDFNTGMRLISPDGSVHIGADAAHGVVRVLPGWRRLAWLYRVPGIRPICQRVYDWIAARRYALAEKCDSGVCNFDPTI